MWIWLFADAKGKAVKPPASTKTGEKPEEEEEEDEEGLATVGDEVNDVLRVLMPWLTSLLFHIGIVVMALFLIWSFVTVVEEEQPIIPSAKFSETPGARMSETQSQDLQASQQNRKIDSQEVATEDALDNLNSSTQSELKLVGVTGGGGGGKLAPFGVTTGTATGISAGFYGTGGNARKIIYVIDASGSLMDTLPFVIKELKRSIGDLVDKQQFTVIFFQAGTVIEVPPRGWKQATAEMKKRVRNWVTLEQEKANIVPKGSTTPEKAIKLAIAYKPELLFILSDNITGRGKYEVDREELLKFLDKSNPMTKRRNPQSGETVEERTTKINTIQFLYPDPLKTLEEIAGAHGGVYRFVTEHDLGLK